MLELIAGCLFVLVPDGDAKTEVTAKIDVLVKAESYSFKTLSENEGGFGGRGGFGRGGRGARGADEGAAVREAPTPKPVMGVFQKDQPVHLKQDTAELWRVDEDLVYKTADGSWKLYDREAMRGRGRGGRGQGGGGGQAGGADQAERDTLRAVSSMGRTQLPHQLLADVAKALAEVTKEESDGKTTFVATLTSEGAQALSGRGGRGGQRGGRGGQGGGGQGGARGQGGGGSLETSGTIRVSLNEDGALDKIVIETLLSGTMRDTEIERKSKTTIEIGKLGETVVEVPGEVLAQLEI